MFILCLWELFFLISLKNISKFAIKVLFIIWHKTAFGQHAGNFNSPLENQNQRFLINEQNSSWENVEARVPQGSILGRSLIYINDLWDKPSTNAKLFLDNTSLFFVVRNFTFSSCKLKHDFSKVKEMDFSMKNKP